MNTSCLGQKVEGVDVTPTLYPLGLSATATGIARAAAAVPTAPAAASAPPIAAPAPTAVTAATATAVILLFNVTAAANAALSLSLLVLRLFFLLGRHPQTPRPGREQLLTFAPNSLQRLRRRSFQEAAQGARGKEVGVARRIHAVRPEHNHAPRQTFARVERG